MSAGVRLERSGRVATIVFDRPEAKNAIDLATMDALDHIVFDLEADPEVSAVIVTGAGGSFVSGGDIKDFGRIVGPEAAREMSLKMQAILQRLSELPVPSLAAIEGDAHGGGCEVALFPDIRVATPGSRFIFKQLDMGLMTGWGGGQRLARIVGYPRALLWLSTAATVSAGDALSQGLVDEVAPGGNSARAWAERLAAKIAEKPRASLVAQKAALSMSQRLSPAGSVAYEAERFASTWGSDAHTQAVARFLGRSRG